MAAIRRSDLELGEELGSGGFGAVFRGLWKTENKHVAVKILHKVDFREIDILKQLQHPNIVTLYGFVHEKIDLMMVMELCDLGSLRSFLEQHKDDPLSLPLIHDWMFQAALPIDFLRHHKVQHMDIKTDNFVITSNMILKLTDFGLSQILENTRSYSSEAGSWRWMPPERLREHKLSPKFDIYALALVLWCLFTRVLPYAEYPTEFSIAKAVCDDKVRPKIPPDCPKPIASLIEACWHDDRTKRPDIRDVIVILAHHRAAFDNISERHSLTQTKAAMSTTDRSHKYRDASTQTVPDTTPHMLPPPLPPPVKLKPDRNIPLSKQGILPQIPQSKARYSQHPSRDSSLPMHEVKSNSDDGQERLYEVPPDATELPNVPPPLPSKGPRQQPKLPSVKEDVEGAYDVDPPYYIESPSVSSSESLKRPKPSKESLRRRPPCPPRPDKIKGLHTQRRTQTSDQDSETPMKQKQASTIMEWLLDIGLPQYGHNLLNNGWEKVEHLDSLTERKLIDLDITDRKHRKQMLESIRYGIRPPSNVQKNPSPRKDENFPTKNKSGIYEDMTIQQQAIYKAKELNYSYLHVGEKLADRFFGAMYFGTYQHVDADLYVFPVTVQTDGGEVIDEAERLKEVKILSRLDHPNILRMIGFCEGEGEFTGHTVLIVSEHVAVGSLNKHLRKRSDVGVQDVLKLMLQVAEAMRYLNEKVNVVHRDVAARNILLVDDDHAKISNFQLATVMKNKEYTADTAGKLIPLKWYAPECIYDLTFSSKSDVWSYGIALWEALSYGKRPYRNMRTNEVMPFLENDKRLPKPERCSEDIYELMQRCWSWDPGDRPSFLDIIVEIEGILYE